MMMELLPTLVLSQPFQASRPSIIRPVADIAGYFPVQWDRGRRTAITTELARHGMELDDRVSLRKFLAHVEEKAGAVPTGMFFPRTPYDLSFTAGANNSANLFTYTFAGLSIGPAHPLRYVLVVGNGQFETVGSAGITGTIGGVAATNIHERGIFTSGANWWVYLLLPVATGTTATVTVTLPNRGSLAGVAVYRVINPPRLTRFAISSNANGGTKTVDVPAGGYVLGTGFQTNTGDHAWPASVPESYDSAVGSGRLSFGAGFFANAATAQSVAVSGSLVTGLISI